LNASNFYLKYGFKVIEEKIHAPTGEQLLRLKFTPVSSRD
jgi:putative acetyltransferase